MTLSAYSNLPLYGFICNHLSKAILMVIHGSCNLLWACLGLVRMLLKCVQHWPLQVLVCHLRNHSARTHTHTVSMNFIYHWYTVSLLGGSTWNAVHNFCTTIPALKQALVQIHVNYPHSRGNHNSLSLGTDVKWSGKMHFVYRSGMFALKDIWLMDFPNSKGKTCGC
jgi:hypothetical protein